MRIIDFNSDEASKHHFKARGSVYDISGGIGYQFNWCCDTISFAPLVGWSYYHQTIKSPPFYALQHRGFEAGIRNRPTIGMALGWDSKQPTPGTAIGSFI